MVWNIWKEQNGRIFKGRSNPLEDIWKQTRLHIIESLGLQLWESLDLKASPAKARILARWGINSIPAYIGHAKKTLDSVPNPEKWEPPPQAIFKLNFDGAAKGNLGWAGIGGAIRDTRGTILRIYWRSIGENTNNVAKLKALLAGLDMAQTHGWFLVILEGDSQIILQMAEKLLNGK